MIAPVHRRRHDDDARMGEQLAGAEEADDDDDDGGGGEGGLVPADQFVDDEDENIPLVPEPVQVPVLDAPPL